MKKIFLATLAATISAGLIACGSGGGGSGSGSERNANMANRAGANTHNTSMNTAGNGSNVTGNSSSRMSADSHEDFMHEAAQGGMAEVEMGKLAAQKGQNAEVKKFGQMMVTDHSKANEELKGIATKKSVPLPADLGTHKSSMDKLSSLSGAEFDRTYVQMMVEDHEKDVAAFQKQADSGTDPEVKAFAAKTLPTLKKHLTAIQEIEKKLQ
jgi:putative membrane protein